MNIGFIGAGKVGCSLGKYFSINDITVTGYFSRSRSSAETAAVFTGTKAYSDVKELLQDSDTVFITVPDSAVTSVYRELSSAGISGKVICHCSGSMSSGEAFPDIAEHGAKGISIHPLYPFSSRTESYKELGSAFFCLEGDAECTDTWEKMLSSLGCRTRSIDGNVKSKYHAACSVASNLVCGLINESISLLGECGFTSDEALAALSPLIRSNIGNILSAGPVNALTGPVERNDVQTVRKHLGCITDKDSNKLYKAAAKVLVGMAEEKHPEADYKEMLSALEE